MVGECQRVREGQIHQRTETNAHDVVTLSEGTAQRLSLFVGQDNHLQF